MSERLHFLIVDDDLISLLLLEKVLKSKGHKVRKVNSGKEALYEVGQEVPDIIILDVLMPDMDGYQTFKKLKEFGIENVPIVFLTGKSEIVSMKKGFELGAVDYISKPFHGQDLIARMEGHVRLAKLNRQN